MYIKNIFDVWNYKGLEDGFWVNFDDVTYIVGDNAKNKTTIGSMPLWILTGYNLYGSNKEQVSNDKLSKNVNTIASMTIIDNQGSEHIITRCKGKDNFVMLDGVRTTQEIISRFYKDVHAFICAYNPTYFRSMEQSKQRELLLRILPTISSEEAFDLLEEEERLILESPVVDIKGYCKAKRSNIKELNSKLEQIEGSKKIYIDLALQNEGEILEFTKQKELQQLENQYEQLVTSTDNIVSIEELEKDIKKIDNKIINNINIELKELQSKQNKELENLENVSSETSNCPTCKQSIKNENLIKALTINYKRNINNIADKIEKLKVDTQELIEKKKLQVHKYEIMKTPEMQEKTKRREQLKEEIHKLNKEKSEIDLHNKEVKIKQEQILNAKRQLELLEKATQEIIQSIEKYNKQLKVVNKLNLLIIQEQMKKVKKHLNKVTIEFTKVDKETGEILDENVYEVKYEGRDYEKLSKSYKLRADIEIAQLINKVVEIETPMFLDDVESITQIEFNSDIQTILSIVIKYNELEVLYSYPEVLKRERESINKKIEESSSLFQNVA